MTRHVIQRPVTPRPAGPRPSRLQRARGAIRPVLAAAIALGLTAAPALPAQAKVYQRISGTGSTWSENALRAWAADVQQFGMKVDYSGTGSTAGRNDFKNGTNDFALSEIPYGVREGKVVEALPARKFAYMPIVAGGTSFMYHLTIGGKRVTQLRLSGQNLTRIFTGAATRWNDPAIQAENPGLVLPARRIIPVYRSDGSGTTAQLTLWMSKLYRPLWDAYCRKVGRPVSSSGCGLTSQFPGSPGMVGQAYSNGVAGYVAQGQSEGTITYVEYSYALDQGFPVVKLLNRAGYYVEPTAENVAVALTQAQVETKNTNPAVYLTQKLDRVYAFDDQRTYPLSSYSYMIVPTEAKLGFSNAKGQTLADFAYFFLCEGQQQAKSLGYSPLPINLVQAGLSVVKTKIPGADVKNINIKGCHNPTFSADGRTNTLARTAPYPPACAKAGPLQCGTKAVAGGAKSGGTKPGVVAGAGGKSTQPVNRGNGAGARTGGGTAAGTGARPGGVAPGGAQPSAGPVAGAVIDPDTGQVADGGTGGDTGDGTVVAGTERAGAIPVNLAADSTSDGTRQTVMILAVLMLLVVAVGPPLLAQNAFRKGGK